MRGRDIETLRREIVRRTLPAFRKKYLRKQWLFDGTKLDALFAAAMSPRAREGWAQALIGAMALAVLQRMCATRGQERGVPLDPPSPFKEFGDRVLAM